VDVPTANPSGQMPAKDSPRGCRRGARRGAHVGSTVMVSHVGVHDARTTATVAAVAVDHPNSERGPVVEVPVATGRLAYLRQQIHHIGYGPEDLEGIMEGVSKRGDQKAYDTPVRLFFEWAVRELGPHSIDSRTLCPAIMIKYLQHLHLEGKSVSVLAHARSAVSATVSIATDGKVALGESPNVKRFMAGLKQKAPVGPKKLAVPSYHNVALLYSLVWLYGPNEALSDGLLKEKLVTLLLVDGAMRPSDLHRINRSKSGRHRQIEIDRTGMSLRYWWPKEVVPGSNRRNSTNTWFSKWVRIQRTKPTILCSVQTMEDFLRRTSDPCVFATRYLVQIQSHVQPLVWGLSRGGMLLPGSVDHVSNIVQANMDLAAMGKMTPAHIRGASTSKITDLVPALREAAMELGRWTTVHTFDNHYHAPMLTTPREVPAAMRSNPQQVLCWGWKAKPPRGVSTSEYERPPDYWVGKTFPSGKIVSFDGGTYSVRKSRGISWASTHEELMIWVGSSR